MCCPHAVCVILHRCWQHSGDVSIHTDCYVASLSVSESGNTTRLLPTTEGTVELLKQSLCAVRAGCRDYRMIKQTLDDKYDHTHIYLNDYLHLETAYFFCSLDQSSVHQYSVLEEGKMQ